MKKAILIDVNNKTIREVTVTKDERGSQLKSMYEHIGCELVEVVNIGENDIYVDEEGLLNLLPTTNFFMWKGYPQPLAGNGLILGYDDSTGDSTDVTLTVEDVKNNVRFMTHREVVIGSYINQW